MGKNRASAFYALCRPYFATVKNSCTTISRQKTFMCNLKSEIILPRSFALHLSTYAIAPDFQYYIGLEGEAHVFKRTAALSL